MTHNAAYEAMEAATQARGQKRRGEACSRSKMPGCQTFNGTNRNTLENTEALEKRVKTVAMRAESLATTEADFFKTLLNRQ